MTSIHIHLDLQQLVEAVKQLSPQEKLKLSEALWEEDASIPKQHQALVLDRVKKSKKDQDRLLDWTKASKSLKSR